MAVVTEEVPGWTKTTETGYALKFRKTGDLARIQTESFDDDRPTLYTLTDDGEHPIYVAEHADWISRVLGTPQQQRWTSSEAVPSLGFGINPQDLEPVLFERVTHIRTEPVQIDLPAIFDLIGVVDLPGKTVESLVGSLPDLPPGAPGYVGVGITMPEGGFEAVVKEIGRNIFFRHSITSRRLLAVVDARKIAGSVRSHWLPSRSEEWLMLVCTPYGV